MEIGRGPSSKCRKGKKKTEKGAYHTQLLSEGGPFRKTHRMSSSLCDGLNPLQRVGPLVAGLFLPPVKEGSLSDGNHWSWIVASAVPFRGGRLLLVLPRASAQPLHSLLRSCQPERGSRPLLEGGGATAIGRVLEVT